MQLYISHKQMEENKMRNMKKVLAIVLALALAVCMVACSGGSGSAAAEVYTYEEDFVEAGYEGDCINTNAYTLVLSGDSYVLQYNFLVNQISGVIVASTKTQYKGSCSVTEADGVKTVTLEAPTSASCNMNGTVTTEADDPALLTDFEWTTITCDTATLTMTLA